MSSLSATSTAPLSGTGSGAPTISGVLDADSAGRVLVSCTVGVGEQLAEFAAGEFRLLTDLSSAVTGRYVPGGRRIVACTADGGDESTLYLFDADAVTDDDDPDEPHHDGPLVSAVEMTALEGAGPDGAVLTVDPAGKLVAYIGEDGVATLDLRNCSSVTVPGNAASAAFAPDSSALAIAEEIGDLCVVSFTDESVYSLPGVGSLVGWVQVGGQAEVVVATPDGELTRIHPRSAARTPLRDIDSDARCATSADGAVLAVADGAAISWIDPATGAVLASHRLDGTDRIDGLHVDPTGAAAFALSSGPVPSLWRVGRANGVAERLI